MCISNMFPGLRFGISGPEHGSSQAWQVRSRAGPASEAKLSNPLGQLPQETGFNLSF